MFVEMSPTDKARLDRVCESPICATKGRLARRARKAMERPVACELVATPKATKPVNLGGKSVDKRLEMAKIHFMQGIP